MPTQLIPIDAARFEEQAVAIVGTASGWQALLAERLGINRATVFRWLDRGEAPQMALLALDALEADKRKP